LGEEVNLECAVSGDMDCGRIDARGLHQLWIETLTRQGSGAEPCRMTGL